MSATRDAARALLEYALLEKYRSFDGRKVEWAARVVPMVEAWVVEICAEHDYSVIRDAMAEDDSLVCEVEHLFAEFASGVDNLMGSPRFETESLHVRSRRKAVAK